jgi:hypothetical protein
MDVSVDGQLMVVPKKPKKPVPKAPLRPMEENFPIFLYNTYIEKLQHRLLYTFSHLKRPFFMI